MSIIGAQADVEAFHKAHGTIDPSYPQIPHPQTTQLRIDLITEEFDELIHELVQMQHPQDLSKIKELGMLAKAAGEMADLVYVILGTASALGIDMAPVWEELQRANMAKAGGPLRADGKHLKPEGWKAPDFVAIIREQVAEHDFADRSIKG